MILHSPTEEERRGSDRSRPRVVQFKQPWHVSTTAIPRGRIEEVYGGVNQKPSDLGFQVRRRAESNGVWPTSS